MNDIFGDNDYTFNDNLDTIVTVRADEAKKLLVVSYGGKDIKVSLSQTCIRFGNAKDNDLIISSPFISPYHGTLIRQGNDYVLIDGQDRDNKDNYKRTRNLTIKGKQIERKKLENGDTIQISHKDYGVQLVYYDIESKRQTIPTIKLDREITIGRSHNNDLHLNYIDVSSYHAKIIPVGNKQHTLQDLGSTNGTWVNGQRLLKKQKIDLKPNDTIKIVDIEFRYDGQTLSPFTPQQTLAGETAYRLDASNLKTQVIPRGKVDNSSSPNWVKEGNIALLDDISLVIKPRQFVALVGGSGAGKSTLLGALNGTRPTTEKESKVLINGTSLYQNFDNYREFIGYVPQQDIIHKNLSVKQALHYAAQLRAIPRSKINDEIDRVLALISMQDKKETMVKDLSGGQKKRVSIAVELIADPPILYLDEPTSGLDPGLDMDLMGKLRGIAKAGKTVVLVTHATENIGSCDLVAFLAKGGRLTFYGKPDEALKFFNVKKFSLIYQLVAGKPEKWIDKFESSDCYKQYITNPLKQSSKDSSKKVEPTKKEGCFTLLKNLRTSIKQELEPIRQIFILSNRYLSITMSDKIRLLFLLAMGPLIALLFFFVVDQGLFTGHLNTGDITKDWQTVIDMQQVLFIMACVGVFFGIFSSIQEISKERAIYDREQLANLDITAYVFSKLSVLSMLWFLQSILLIWILDFWADFPDKGLIFPWAKLELSITFFLTLFVSTSLGLFISASVKDKTDWTMNILAFVIVVQIIFGGVIFNLEGYNKYLTWLTFTRWSTEAMGAITKLSESLHASNLHLEFGGRNELLLNWVVLTIYSLLLIAGTILILKNQDITKNFTKRS